jgi:hypothetical protein
MLPRQTPRSHAHDNSKLCDVLFSFHPQMHVVHRRSSSTA